MTSRLAWIARRIAFASIVTALAGCAGSGTVPGGTPGAGASGPSAARANGKAIVTITVPKAAGDRKPAYVSSATKAMTIAFRRGGKIAAQTVVPLSAGSPGCSKVASGTKCKVTISLKACSNGTNCYLADVVTYDAVTCKGKPATCTIPSSARQLSTEQKYPVAIFAGQNTVLTLALAGIPVSTTILPADIVTRVDGDAFDLIGQGAHALVVEFLDADGNVIVGAGTPSLALSAVSGGLSPVIVATPSAGANEIYVSPPAAFDGTDTASFKVTPSFTGQATNGCVAPNANCAPVTVTVDMVRMVAIAASGLQLYALGDATPLATLDGGIDGVAADGSGTLYTGYAPAGCQAGALLGAYAPPLVEGQAALPLECGFRAIAQVANRTAYVMWVDVPGGFHFNTAYCSNAACTQVLSEIEFLNNAVAADSAGDVAANVQPYLSSACQLQYGTQNPSQFVTIPGQSPCAQSMAFDAAGDLFSIVPSGMQVVELSKTGAQTAISTNPNIPYDVAIDGNGNVLVAGQNPSTLAATLQETLATTLGANQGGTVVPDHSVVLASPPAGQGTASEALATAGETAYVQYSFLAGSSGSFATFALPGLTQVGATVTNVAVGVAGMQVLP